MNEEPFSRKHGFRQTTEAEITIRHDAPYDLRGVFVELAYSCNMGPKALRPVVCRV